MTITKATLRRSRTAYDEATPEKVAFGKRMREAREISGMSQAEAAEAMGYSQAVQLSMMESGNRMPTLHVLVHCASLYGVTMDFLVGLTTDGDRDPAITVQREIATRVAAEVRGLIATITAGAVIAVRELKPDAGRTARLAGQVVELAATLGRMRERHGEVFDELHAGAQLVARADAALHTAHEHLAAVARAQRQAAVVPVDLSGIVGLEAVGDLADLAARLASPRPLSTDAHAPDDEPDDFDTLEVQP